MRLVLVRHAETERSARGRCYGSLDVGLSAVGRAQCATLAQAMADEPLAAIVTSPRVRAIETAEAIAAPHALVPRVDDDLRELDFGELEGRTYDEISATQPDLYARWMSTPTEVRFPGGESYADLRARALSALTRIREDLDGRTVVAVTHGGIVRALVGDVLGMPADRVFRIAVDPGSVTVVEWLDGEPVVLGLNAPPAPRSPAR